MPGSLLYQKQMLSNSLQGLVRFMVLNVDKFEQNGFLNCNSSGHYTVLQIYSKLTILNVLLECMQIKNPSKPELFKTTLSTVFCINNKLLHCRSNWLRYGEHSIIWLQLIIFLNRLGGIFVIFKQYKFRERLKISRERENTWCLNLCILSYQCSTDNWCHSF